MSAYTALLHTISREYSTAFEPSSCNCPCVSDVMVAGMWVAAHREAHVALVCVQASEVRRDLWHQPSGRDVTPRSTCLIAHQADGVRSARIWVVPMSSLR